MKRPLKPTDKVCRCDVNPDQSKHSAVDGQSRASTANEGDGQAPVPRFRVSSWIVMRAPWARDACNEGGPLDIVLSGSGRLVHGHWMMYSILSGMAYTYSTNYLTVHRASFLLPFLLLMGSQDPTKGRESTEHLSHWRNFAIRSNSCSPRMKSCWVNCDLVRSCQVSNIRFVTSTYGLTGHTLAKYPTKRLPRARSIKGMAIGMGAS
ncbi:hypothetical protein HAX54_047745 [Datura stramonium]|uniref:Uncharacterized protein n=1 Tax=Datura stramonium TaxID=4076 RepID=A0ABS8STK1_DATST|nr:hypothetical protein [Datura stramonium]